MTKHKNSVLILSVVAFLLISLACGSSTAQQLASAVPATTNPNQAAGNEAATQPAQNTQATNVPESILPSATPSPQPESLTITSQGLGQDGQTIGYGFIVHNPNSNYAFESSDYQIALYNAEGTVIETDSGYIELILPGQNLGVGGNIYLDEGLTATKMDIQLSAGNVIVSDLVDLFVVEKTAYLPGDYSSYAVGVINNPYDKDITSLRVSALVYNDAKEIIGGGLTYLNFLLAQKSIGVSVSVTSNGTVANVELYPALSGLSLLETSDQLPEGASNLVLSKQGYGQDGSNLAIGMILENPNQGYSIENSLYHVTSYSSDGSVLGVSDGYINLLLPGQILGVADAQYLDEGAVVSTIDIQIMTGDYTQSDVIPTFTSENVSFLADQYSPQVTGEILNPYSQEVTNVRVDAIAYNDAGDIIGSGFTYLDFIPANTKAAASVYLSVAGTPAKVELYAAVSALSEIGG